MAPGRSLIASCLLSMAALFLVRALPAAALPDCRAIQMKNHVCGVNGKTAASHDNDAEHAHGPMRDVPSIPVFAKTGAGPSAHEHEMKDGLKKMARAFHGKIMICHMKMGGDGAMGGCCLKNGCEGAAQGENGATVSGLHLLACGQNEAPGESLDYMTIRKNGAVIFKPSAPDPRPPRF